MGHGTGTRRQRRRRGYGARSYSAFEPWCALELRCLARRQLGRSARDRSRRERVWPCRCSVRWVGLTVVNCGVFAAGGRAVDRGGMSTLARVADPAAVADRIESELAPLQADVARVWWDMNVEASEENEQRRIERETALSDYLADRTASPSSRRRERRPPVSRAAGSTCCATASFPSRFRRRCAHRSSSSRRRSRRASPNIEARSPGCRSTTTRSSRSCARATTSPSGARHGRRQRRSGPSSPTTSAARETAQRSRPGARLPRLVRALHRDVRDGRGQAVRDARPVRPGDRRAVRALEGRARRNPCRPLRMRRGRPPALALRRPVLPGGSRRGRRRPDALSRGARHRRALPATYDGLGLETGASWSAAICFRATARASTPSASTSTAPATSACSPTSCRIRTGWTRCCTSSATARSTPASTRAAVGHAGHAPRRHGGNCDSDGASGERCRVARTGRRGRCG